MWAPDINEELNKEIDSGITDAVECLKGLKDCDEWQDCSDKILGFALKKDKKIGFAFKKDVTIFIIICAWDSVLTKNCCLEAAVEMAEYSLRPAYRHGEDAHGSKSISHSLPVNRSGQMHLKLVFPKSLHNPELKQGCVPQIPKLTSTLDGSHENSTFVKRLRAAMVLPPDITSEPGFVSSFKLLLVVGIFHFPVLQLPEDCLRFPILAKSMADTVKV
uniref:Uncharacterized protein n=1 Tax=Glossina pallidipes TaxID=7398 RepID=A0A1A9ZFZ5_GLOPL